jgi:hypothetical protein
MMRGTQLIIQALGNCAANVASLQVVAKKMKLSARYARMGHSVRNAIPRTSHNSQRAKLNDKLRPSGKRCTKLNQPF